MNKLLVVGLVFLAVFGWDSEVVAQGCSQCKLIAEQGSELDESSFGSNINYGILWLMVIPYILLFIFFRKRIVNLFKSLTTRP